MSVRSACEGHGTTCCTRELCQRSAQREGAAPSTRATSADLQCARRRAAGGSEARVYAASSSAYGTSPASSCGDDGPAASVAVCGAELTGELYMQATGASMGSRPSACATSTSSRPPGSGLALLRRHGAFILMMMRDRAAHDLRRGEQGPRRTHIENVVSANCWPSSTPRLSRRSRVSISHAVKDIP